MTAATVGGAGQAGDNGASAAFTAVEPVRPDPMDAPESPDPVPSPAREATPASPGGSAPPARPKRKTTARRLARWVGQWLLGLYLVYAAVMFGCQRRLIFPRDLAVPRPNAGQGIPRLERLWLETPAGKVEGWFLPGDGVSPQQPGPAVIFAHGNAELIDDWPLEMSAYRRLGVSVLLPEYRGYGRSAGAPSQKALTEDFVQFYDLLAARPEVDRRRIIFHGRSIGGGVVCALAAERPPAALVLQSTFTSVADFAKRYLVPRFLVTDPFDNEAVLPRLTCPVILFHGRRDNIIPFAQAEALQRAARGSRLVVYDCAHNDCPPDWVDFMRAVADFLREAGVLPPAEPSPRAATSPPAPRPGDGA
jgi:fermentation-respiration switch protein FrsA (DUF1100 family)